MPAGSHHHPHHYEGRKGLGGVSGVTAVIPIPPSRTELVHPDSVFHPSLSSTISEDLKGSYYSLKSEDIFLALLLMYCHSPLPHQALIPQVKRCLERPST